MRISYKRFITIWEKKNLNYPIKLYKVVDNKKNVIKMKL